MICYTCPLLFKTRFLKVFGIIKFIFIIISGIFLNQIIKADFNSSSIKYGSINDVTFTDLFMGITSINSPAMLVQKLESSFLVLYTLYFLIFSFELIIGILDGIEKRYIILESSGVSSLPRYLTSKFLYLAIYNLLYLLSAIFVLVLYTASVTRIAFKDLGILIGGSFLLLYGLVLSSSMITISLAKDKGQGILLILLIFLLLIVPLYFKKEFKFTSPLNTIVFIASIIDPIKYVTLGIIAYPIHYYIVFLVSGLIMFSLKVSRFGV